MYTSTSSTTYFPPNPSTSSSSSPPDDDRDVPSTQPPPQQHSVIVRPDNLAAQQMLQSGILADRTPDTPYSYYSEIYGNLPLFFTPEWSQMVGELIGFEISENGFCFTQQAQLEA
ncbi:unnamed protein product, partial [Mesorhabditis belari]|uniref:Uncharacterized protein n=1 Tax=Mesorhabditis belari TaxID=2138241 RepID=A0AAF3ELD9_9BILA